MRKIPEREDDGERRFGRHAMGTRQSGGEEGGLPRRWAFFQGPYVARVCPRALVRACVSVGGSVPTLDREWLPGVIWQAEQSENTWVFCLLAVCAST